VLFRSGPFRDDKIIDLSRGAAEQLGITGDGAAAGAGGSSGVGEARGARSSTLSSREGGTRDECEGLLYLRVKSGLFSRKWRPRWVVRKQWANVRLGWRIGCGPH